MADINELLGVKDRNILDAKVGQSWVPKEPRELLLPYIDESSSIEEKDIDTRRRKAKEVYDGYIELSNKCKELKEVIEETCKNVTITLNPSSENRVIDAVKRTFGTDGTQITFEMYKLAIEKLSDLNNKTISKPGV